MVKIPSIEEMLIAGMHFGHRTSKWYPKMEPYIFASRSGVHIINLEITQRKLAEAMEYIAGLIAENKVLMLVGTKTQVKGKLKAVGDELKLPYVNEKWLAGLLTNFSVVKKMIRRYRDLKEKLAAGKLDKYTKKERLNFEKELGRMDYRVGGLIDLDKMPDAIFIWDVKKDETALKEALKMKIPIIAVCDTNANPEGISYVIPSNDDATKTIELVMNTLRDAVMEGRKKIEKNI